MANQIISNLDFYAPWPKFGTKLSHQWGEIRANTESLNPIVQGTVVDADPNLIKAGDLAGFEFGEEDFHNKFRIFWNKGPQQFQFQCNDGTELSPLWTTAFYVDCAGEDIQFNFDTWFAGDLHVAGGFYQAGAGSTATITVTDTTASRTYDSDKITFSRDGFYLTTDTAGKPIINLDGSIGGGGGSGEANTAENAGAGTSIVATPAKSGTALQFKSLTAGTNITFSPSSSSNITINSTASGSGGGSGFYGINVKQVSLTSGDVDSWKGINTLSFETSNFYITQNPTNTDEVLINWRDASANNGDPTVVTGILSRNFTGVEWTFNHNFNETNLLWATYDSIKEAIIPDKVDTSDPNTTYFYFTNSITGTAVLSTGRASTSVTFKETETGGASYEANTLKFDSQSFYLTSSSTDGKPIVSLIDTLDEKSYTIPYPGRNTKWFWWVPATDITVERIYHVLEAKDSGFYPSVDWTVRYGSDPHGTGTELITDGSLTSFYPGAPSGDASPISSFNNPNIPAGNQVWLEVKDIGEGAGVEEQFHITLHYKNT